jgi:uncharacterized repeat protein (TIGR03803 family)
MSKFTWVTKACGVFLLWAAAAVALPAQTFTSLFSFDHSDGYGPFGALVQGADGSFYGTTAFGGANKLAGTVFKITPGGTLTTLYNFCSLTNCTDGDSPYGTLVQGTDGNFYGTTDGGGANGNYGTVFKITPSGTLTTLYSFCSESDCADGENPVAGLALADDGNFYGITEFGGVNENEQNCQSSCGTLFRITPTGTLTTLYSFCAKSDCTDGAIPYAGVIQASNGDFYGTTNRGGVSGNGAIYKITPSGVLTTFSYDVAYSEGVNRLVQASDGNLYGSTCCGGTNDTGSILKITPNGTVTTLYSFPEEKNGVGLEAGLVQGTDGYLYGTASSGGAKGDGTVFRVSLSGTLRLLHTFDGTDGGSPISSLVQGTNGGFYGTTNSGGADNAGTVFSLNVGLGQFVETLPTSGKAGATVKILGSFLTGATSVTFNGTAATFSVNSKSEITTTVPIGATTGIVQVITPRLGTLSSNLPFTVRP